MYCSDQTCFFNERTKFWSLGLGQSSQVIGLAHIGLGEKNNTHTDTQKQNKKQSSAQPLSAANMEKLVRAI
jgi:hypothetical protein